MMKIWGILAAFFLLAACSGGGGSAQTDPSQLFSLEKWQSLTPGTVYSTQISGSDSEGRTATGTFSVANRDAVMRNSILVTPVDLLISLASVDETRTMTGTSYVDQDGYLIEVYAEGVTCVPVSYGKMPATVKVGDFGILPEVVCDDRTTMTQNWRAESEGVNKIKIVMGATKKNLGNAILATTEQSLTLGSDGDILGYKMVAAGVGYSFNFTNN